MTDELNCPECGVEVDEHEAGRCLDRWVAKDVMGLPDGCWDYYSVHIDRAWKVIEKMRNDGWVYEISLHDVGPTIVMWKNPIGNDVEGDGENLGEFALAVNRAALKAVHDA